MEGRLPEIPEGSPGLHPASEASQPVRIMMVNREAFVLTYVWHLTAFFGRVCPVGLPVWECWSYADIARPSGMAAASEAVRAANWVVFCQATQAALPLHIRRWAGSWPFPRREAELLVGFFSLIGDDSGSEGKAQAFLRNLARKAHWGFVAIRDCLWGARPDVPRDLRTSNKSDQPVSDLGANPTQLL